MNNNKIAFNAICRAEIIECEYQKKLSLCDVIINLNIDEQSVSYIEVGKVRKFKSESKTFDKNTDFIVLEDINTKEIHYIQLHFNERNELYCIALTNSKDTGHIYYDEKIKKMSKNG